MDAKPKNKPKARPQELPLEPIRLVLKQHAVLLQPIINQVGALPVDDKLEYYFVPMQYMEEYRPFYRPGQPFKNLKLVNFNRPAISLSFSFKHKYTLERPTVHADVLLHLKNHRDELFNRLQMQQLSASQQNELRQTDELLRTIRDNPQAYETCFSNYHHYYKYWYCNFRYFQEGDQTKAETNNEHLLKHTERIKGQVHERLNIIFIDPHFIRRPVPHDNKMVDRILDNFPIHIRQGITTLYLRKTDETNVKP